MDKGEDVMISKELLSLVLGEEVHENIMKTNAWGANDNYLTYFISSREPENIIEHHINLDTLGRLVREKLRSMNYVTTMYIHVDTVAISLSQDGKKIYSTPPMTTRSELECSIEALDYVVDL